MYFQLTENYDVWLSETNQDRYTDIIEVWDSDDYCDCPSWAKKAYEEYLSGGKS